jgi:hypothetical protein
LYHKVETGQTSQKPKDQHDETTHIQLLPKPRKEPIQMANINRFSKLRANCVPKPPKHKTDLLD